MAKVLACIDGSIYSQSVCDHAAWAATRMAAPIEILHVLGRREVSSVPADLSGNLGADGQEALLTELSILDGQRAKLAQKRGWLILDEAKARLQADGMAEVATRLRNGDIVETLTELEGEADLVVIGKRGEAADFATLHLGSNLERVARSSRKPVFVAARAFKPVERFLVAFDGGPSATKAVETIAREPLLSGIACHLLMAGPDEGEARSRLDRAAARLREAGFDVQARIEPGHPEDVIAGNVEKHAIDLLVMGAYGHSRIRNLIIGSTTTALLRSCKVPVLMFR